MRRFAPWTAGGLGLIGVALLLKQLEQPQWAEWPDRLDRLAQVMTILGGGFAIWFALMQLIPLRRDIERLAEAERRGAAFRKALVAPSAKVVVRGFDARFTNGDWHAILSEPVAPATIQLSLDRSPKIYQEELERNPPPFSEATVLIISTVHSAELLQRGWIDPIPDSLEFTGMMALRAGARGQKYDKAAVELARYLCSDAEGTVGALPLWINSHGRMIPDPQLFEGHGRIANVSTLDELFRRDDAADVLAEASVQGYNLTFEFWAHLAYRGCRLFRASDADLRTFRSDVLACPEELVRFAEAVADLGTRLRFSSRTRDAFMSARDRLQIKEENRFDIGQNADARMIRESLALWKPVFSSELLWKASRRHDEPAARLTDQTDFRPPYYRHANRTDWSYLSTIGGYGLALPKGAAKNPECVKALKYLFLANPCVMHPYVPDMMGYEPTAEDIRNFAERHARPRWPFWRPASKEISKCLVDLLMSVDRETTRTPFEFRANTIEKVKESRDRITAMLTAIRTIASEQQPRWTFEL